ncbi:competence protein ComEA [Thiothrix eikelboomii]|uniref:Competence protein ComEA n=1 Tax=Thiothrix eikelboomii TaxID=92487 RepID=A0A1T4W6E0_9GAMM|nr:helix-hairpin-helix domain-containing protein [Thiothrix eikelboomii]SKA72595.1 competence protein ComEA [Thiothrix eikelboomii]
MKYVVSLLLVAGSLFASTVSAELVNINKASAEIMQEHLKGIGAKKAEAIISYRTEHGEFKNLEDIKEVKGIGDALFEKIKADISLDQGLTTDGAAGAEGKTKVTSKLEDKATKVETKAGSEIKVDKETPKKATELAD